MPDPDRAKRTLADQINAAQQCLKTARQDGSCAAIQVALKRRDALLDRYSDLLKDTQKVAT